MAGCHSADVAKHCPQPWCHLQALSIIPLSQCFQVVLNRGTEPQSPDSHPTMPYLGFSHWCQEMQISVSLCHRSSLCKQLAWQYRGSLLHFPYWELCILPQCLAMVSPHVLGRLQDQAPCYPAGHWFPSALGCIPSQTAVAALWTFTFPLLKPKPRHMTKLRAPKISGGMHYWEQKPARLSFSGWLLFQSVLALCIRDPWVLGA